MRWPMLFILACVLIVLLLGGTAPFGRVLLAVGAPKFATPFFNDAEWTGVAQYRSKEFTSAATSFRQAKSFHNLGNAEVYRGNYAAALEAYDIAIAGGDEAARVNFDAVAAYFAGLAIDPDAIGFFPKRENGPETEGFEAKGKGRASGTGDQETNASTLLGTLELNSRGRLGVRRVFDDKFMVADDRWLQQLSDVPGEYLKARIGHERKRRDKLGFILPVPEDPG